MSNSHTKLNCAVGDLAITVNCSNPKNLGNIVRVISAVGFQDWDWHDELIYTWNVEIATEHGFLYCLYAGEAEYKAFKSGPVPDAYLGRLTPPSGYLLDEFADAEQLQLHLMDMECKEGETHV
jgi:hypothetical protein